ncbi:MAG: Eco57I restriction-modification methylase domain-containing protein [Bacteroidales bacterium]|nr:Eco57I restriction-modification methylase domain-containing protein [Bacteroidales bacterium]
MILPYYLILYLSNIAKKSPIYAIIGNPPYQVMDGGAGASSMPIYNKFMDLSRQVKPRFVSLIMPARWYTGGKGLDSFRQSMLDDTRIQSLFDYENAQTVFPNVEIKGGICYFLWNAEWKQECQIVTHAIDMDEPLTSVRFLKEDADSDLFIRDPRILAISVAVTAGRELYKEKTFDTMVSSMKPYGLRGDFFKNPEKYGLPDISMHPIQNGITIIGLGNNMKRTLRYIPADYPLPNTDGLETFKIFMPRNWGTGKLQDSTYKTYPANPDEICTETFVQVYPFATANERDNCNRYMQTKFFRIMVSVKKQDQGAARDVYSFVPLQDFTAGSDIDWTLSVAEIDQQLYRKYGLEESEIAFIEEKVRAME